MEKTISVKVIPRSSRAEVIGWEHGLLKVKVSSSPTRGQANTELIQLLSGYFKIAKARVRLVSGEKSRLKRFAIEK